MENTPDQLLTVRQVGKTLGLHPKTVYRNVADPNHAMPEGFKLGEGLRSPRRWKQSEITAYMDSLTGGFEGAA